LAGAGAVAEERRSTATCGNVQFLFGRVHNLWSCAQAWTASLPGLSLCFVCEFFCFFWSTIKKTVADALSFTTIVLICAAYTHTYTYTHTHTHTHTHIDL